MPAIRWQEAYPVEVRAIVQPLLDRLAPLFPAWFRTLYVCWSDESEGTLADVDPGEEYRWATLTVYAKLLNLPPEDRLRTVAHELGHIYLNRLDSVVVDALAALADDGAPARRLAEAQYGRAAEATAEDIAALLMAVLGTAER